MIIKYDSKYDEEIKNLLVELQEYIVSIDREKYNIITPEYRDEYFKKTLEEVNSNKGLILLAKEDEKIIGLIVGLINNEQCSEYDFTAPKRGRICELIVSKSCRTHGTGSILLKAMEEHLKSVGCEDILIEVFGYNKLALKFYNKQGYHTRIYELTKKFKNSEDYACKIATLEEVNQKWDYEINKYPNDNSLIVWKDNAVNGIKSKKRICYYGILNGTIITEGTAILSKD